MQPIAPIGSLTTSESWVDSIDGITRPPSSRPISA